jgi:adenine-specific DNA-methyltransferase
MSETICKRYSAENNHTLFKGDCFALIKKIPDNTVDLVVTSPPYCMGKSYERPQDDLATFSTQHEKLLPEIFRVTKMGGSICWQIGYHVKDSVVTPLDYIILDIIKNKLPQEMAQSLMLRNRIAWTFGHGLNCTNRFSGRHETLLWFTKGEDFNFDLDSVRIPQKYPGKRHYKGDKKGELSGNPLGKNPSDVWDIPNVKANHIEKTEHPCQFPISIPQRLIKALTVSNAVVFDPFMGSGSSGVAAVLEGRRFIGSELSEKYYEIAVSRIEQAINGSVSVRDDKPAMKPDIKMSVARLPKEFVLARQGALKA